MAEGKDLDRGLAVDFSLPQIVRALARSLRHYRDSRDESALARAEGLAEVLLERLEATE